MQITINAYLYSNKVDFKVEVDPLIETVLDLKKNIERKVGVMYEHQSITFKNILLCDYQFISVFGIQEGDHLYMEEAYGSAGTFRLHLKDLDGNRTKMIVESFSTISQIKQAVQATEGTYMCQQVLLYEGRVLDEIRTLEEYNIVSESEITLVHV